MKQFDETYILLEEMAHDDYYPGFLVEKVKEPIMRVVQVLERGETDQDIIQEKLDEMACAINELEEEFEENDSELETVARDSIGATVAYILDWFQINIDVETAIRQRDW